MANVIDVDEPGLVHVPKKQEDTSKGYVPMEVGQTGLDSVFDHYQKKIYLFDRSGSMAAGMAPEDEIVRYVWSEETLKKFREEIAEDLEARVMAGDMNADEAEELANDLKDDQKLKKYVIETSRHMENGSVTLPTDYHATWTTERKIEAVRGAMKRFVEKRFQKFPDAQVGMIGFGHQTHWMCYPGAPKPEVLLAVEALAPDMGGTDIVKPIKMGLGEFKRRPSHVGSHHIVMVTDAEACMSKEQVQEFLHQMKELNVMFDFIYVRGQEESTRYAETNPDSVLELLKKMCKETGGEYVEVNKSSDFEVKFFQASERKALPPAGGIR